MVKFPTQITYCDSHSQVVLLDLFISSNTSISSTMTLPLFGKFWSYSYLRFYWLFFKLKEDATFSGKTSTVSS